MTSQTQTAPATPEAALLDGFAEIAGDLWFPERQRKAMDAFSETGFPTLKDERYKYTPIRNFLKTDFALHPATRPVTAQDIEARQLPEMDGLVAVFVNGVFQSALSRLADLPRGLYVAPFSQAKTDDTEALLAHFGHIASVENDAFVALNTAYCREGLLVHVSKGRAIEPVLHILNIVSVEEPALIQPRLLVVAEEGASIRMVESRFSTTDVVAFVNPVSEFSVARDANVSYYLLQDSGAAVLEHHTLQSHQETRSVFTTFALTTSGRLVRNNLSYLPNAEFCTTNLYGVVVGSGQMHVDNATFVDHAMPNCESNELYKHVLADQSTCVFNGKIMVRPDAQKTNAYQSNKTIVVSEGAKIFSKPELEIYADDVKCSHGAATGKIDHDALFYLRARGLNPTLARKLLLVAFVGEVTDKLALPNLKTDWSDRITDRL